MKAASEKVLWHLEHSEKHYMKEADAAETLSETPGCIWEQEFDEDDAQKEQFVAPRPKSRWNAHERHREPARSSRDRSRHQIADRERSRDRGRSSEAAAARSSEGRLVLREQNVTEQKQAVYNFARVLGKCEAVIRTAARVARQASSAFEDTD